MHGREEGLVYLMLRPIAQCQADAGGNFRKAVARGNRVNGSELSQQSARQGRLDQRGSGEGTTTATARAAPAPLTFGLSSETNFGAASQPAVRVLPAGVIRVGAFE